MIFDFVLSDYERTRLRMVLRLARVVGPWRRFRETRQLRKEITRALYDDFGTMLVVCRMTDTKATRVSSFTCGTGTRVGDRRIVKDFNNEYLRLAKGDDAS